LDYYGKAHINKSGSTAFGLRNKSYDADDSDPGIVAGCNSTFNANLYQAPGTNTDPYLAVTLGYPELVNLFPPDYPTLTATSSSSTMALDFSFSGAPDDWDALFFLAEYWNASSSCPLPTSAEYDEEFRLNRWRYASVSSVVSRGSLGTDGTSTVSFSWNQGGKYNCFHTFFVHPGWNGLANWTTGDDVLNIKPDYLEIFRPPYGSAATGTVIEFEDLPGFSAQFDRSRFYQDHLPTAFYSNTSTTPPSPTIIYELVSGLGELVLAPAAGLLGQGNKLINSASSTEWASSSAVRVKWVFGLVGAIGVLNQIPVVQALIFSLIFGIVVFVARWFLKLVKIIK